MLDRLRELVMRRPWRPSDEQLSAMEKVREQEERAERLRRRFDSRVDAQRASQK